MKSLSGSSKLETLCGGVEYSFSVSKVADLPQTIKNLSLSNLNQIASSQLICEYLAKFKYLEKLSLCLLYTSDAADE